MTSYADLNSMEDLEFIAGTQYTLEFTTYTADGVNLLDLTAATVAVTLCYLGQPETSVIYQAGVLSDAANGEWYAILATADTEDLYGTFILQPLIIDSGGDEFTPAQATCVILPKNATS